MTEMFNRLVEEIFNKQCGYIEKGQEPPLLSIVFSHNGFHECTSDVELSYDLRANTHTNTFYGIAYYIDDEQTEPFRIVER